MSIMLQLLGEEREVDAEELDAEVSPHTGRPLRRVHVWVDVTAARSADLGGELNAAREPKDALTSPDATRWVVTSHSHSYVDGDPNHHHDVELRESETLHADRLELLGLTLVPSRYKEERPSDGDPLLVSAIVEVDAEVDAQLEAEIGRERHDVYFDVVRAGVKDEPVRMRFGQCLWQAGEGGARRHLLRLVSEADDGASETWELMYEPERTNVARLALAANAGLAALLDALETAGTLTPEAAEGVRTEMRDRASRALAQADELERHF